MLFVLCVGDWKESALAFACPFVGETESPERFRPGDFARSKPFRDTFFALLGGWYTALPGVGPDGRHGEFDFDSS